jgi:hypothetical protein
MKALDIIFPNIIAGLEAVEEATSLAREHSGSIILLQGSSGSGKTHFAKILTQSRPVFYLRAYQVLTLRMFLAEWIHSIVGFWPMEKFLAGLWDRLLAELRGGPYQTNNHATAGAVTVIDESDYLASGPRHQLLNVIRDVADAVGHTVVLISVSTLAHRLAAPSAFTSQVTNRIVSSVHFDAPTLADAELAARELLEVNFAPDLVSWCYAHSDGSLRGLLRHFQKVESGALAAGLASRRLGLKQARSLGLVPDSRPARVVETATIAAPADDLQIIPADVREQAS